MANLYNKFSVPRTVKVGSQVYDVHFVKDLTLDGQPMYGVQHYTGGTIEINANSVNIDQIQNTLWHEVLHAMWHHMGLDAKIEEEYVTKLSNALTMVLKDNPKLRTMVS